MGTIFQPDPNTAYIMDEIIRQYLNIKSAEDILVALTEFATALYDTSHKLDVCFGFNSVSAIESQADLVFGQGIYRLNSNSVASVYPPNTGEYNSPYRIRPYSYNPDLYQSFTVPKNYMTEFPISIEELLAPQKIQNAYLFASVYFAPNETNKINLQYVSAESGLPISLVKDINLEDVKQLVLDNLLPNAIAVPPDAIEICTVIIDVEYFSGVVGEQSNKINSYVVDKRKSRGWAGFAEENMAVYLIPTLIKYRNGILTAIDANSKTTGLDDRIESLVDDWKALGWPEGFDAFWSGGDYVLPPFIYGYIYG